jgi:predicted lipoprotein with Yx(FWY)xxD motif
VGARARTLAVIAVLGLALVACPDEDPDPEDASAPDAPPTESADEDEDAADDAETTIETSTSELGVILVDGSGMTLYAFLPDERGDPTCTDECLDNWPLVDGPAAAGEGADDELIGTVQHPSGDAQATYNGWPLYYFVGDPVPGDIEGQGLADTWYVLDADGEPLTDAEEDDATPQNAEAEQDAAD